MAGGFFDFLTPKEDEPTAAPAAHSNSANSSNAVEGDPLLTAEYDPVVVAFEADLQSTFEEMAQLTERMVPGVASSTGSAGSSGLRKAINTVVQQQSIVRVGFSGAQHYEQEGADAILFADVPSWITFARISGFRYRIITSVLDPDDEFETYNEGVAFYGTPGASGWADKIGDVAIHYMGSRWVVFSKIFPFSDQAAAREAHEDVLLLGSAKHVMFTPACAWRIGSGGMHATETPLTVLTPEAGVGTMQTTVGRAPIEVLRRLYLTWGHGRSDFAPETEHLHFDLKAVIDEPERGVGHARRFLSNFAWFWGAGPRTRVEENWMRYPAAPLEPTYYAQLLATASSMDDEEQRARAMIEPRATPRGPPQSVAVDIGEPALRV